MDIVAIVQNRDSPCEFVARVTGAPRSANPKSAGPHAGAREHTDAVQGQNSPPPTQKPMKSQTLYMLNLHDFSWCSVARSSGPWTVGVRKADRQLRKWGDGTREWRRKSCEDNTISRFFSPSHSHEGPVRNPCDS